MKTCTKCKEEFPATLEFFHKHKQGKFGLNSRCKECMKKYSNQWAKDNKERIAEYSKQYYQDNKERYAEYDKQYYQDNKERKAGYWKQYAKDNPEKYRNIQRMAKSRYRAREAGVVFKDFTRQDVLDKWGTDCHICKKPVDLDDWHQDHVMPLSKTGPHTLENVKPAHPKCNQVKGNRV